MARITFSKEAQQKLGISTPATTRKTTETRPAGWGSPRRHSLLWQAVAAATAELDSLGWTPEEAKALRGVEATRYFEAKTRLEKAQAKLRSL